MYHRFLINIRLRRCQRQEKGYEDVETRVIPFRRFLGPLWQEIDKQPYLPSGESLALRCNNGGLFFIEQSRVARVARVTDCAPWVLEERLQSFFKNLRRSRRSRRRDGGAFKKNAAHGQCVPPYGQDHPEQGGVDALRQMPAHADGVYIDLQAHFEPVKSCTTDS